MIEALRETSSKLIKEEEPNLKLRLLKNSIYPVIPALINETKAIINPSIDLSETSKEIKYLIGKIKTFIPPNEIIVHEERRSYPANPIAVLNASWIVRLEYMDDIYKLLGVSTVEDKFKTRVLMNEHTLKALELIEIHKNLAEGIIRASSPKEK